MHMLIAYRQGIFSATLRRVYIMTPDHDLTVDFLEKYKWSFPVLFILIDVQNVMQKILRIRVAPEGIDSFKYIHCSMS